MYFELRENGKPIDPLNAITKFPSGKGSDKILEPGKSGLDTAIETATSIPGAIGDAAFTLGIILLGGMLIVGAFLLLRSSKE